MKRQSDPDVLLLQGLADPTRLAILRRLSAEDEVCACEFTSCCGVSQPTTSHHLKVLRETGWVDAERRGSWVYYRLRPEALASLRALVETIEPAAADRASATPASRLPTVVRPTA